MPLPLPATFQRKAKLDEVKPGEICKARHWLAARVGCQSIKNCIFAARQLHEPLSIG